MVHLFHFVIRVMIICSWPICVPLLTVYKLPPTVRPMVRRSIHGPYWSIMVLIRESLNGVLIGRLILQTVVWPTDYKSVSRSTLVKFSALRFGDFWLHRLMCMTNRGSGYGSLMDTVFCTCLFSEKMVCIFFGYRVSHYLPLGNIRPRMKTKLVGIEGESYKPYY